MPSLEVQLRTIGLVLPAVTFFALACDGESQYAPLVAARSSALSVEDALHEEFPEAELLLRDGQVRFIDGTVLTTGDTPEQAAEAFKTKVGRAYNVGPDDLVPLRYILGGREVIPAPEPVGLMYDRNADRYRFWLILYGRQESGIPVYGAELKVLIRNEPGYPVVLGGTTLREISGFVASAATPDLTVPILNSVQAAQMDIAEKANRIQPSTLDVISEPELVIFAGAGTDVVPPRQALKYTGEAIRENGLWLFIADAETGEILYVEDLVHSANVWGRVVGNVTQDPVAAECAPEVPVALPFAEVSIPGVSDGFTGPLGYFFLNNPGTEPVNVVSTLWGRYVDVWNYLGDDERLSRTVTPPGPAFFLQNQSNTDEHVLAQTNAYYHVNRVRSILVQYSPDYPVISEQEDFSVDVNGDETYRFGLFCPADARYYRGRIVFCESGPALSGEMWTNTAFGTIAYHEYGHHILETVGSNYLEYAEGFGDSLAVLTAGDPRYARGYLLGDCDSVMRNADNDCQYDPDNCSSCGDYDHIHDCGNLLSGIVWDLREALAASHPTDFLDILFPLLIDQAPLYEGGGRIDGDILRVMLELDDDDGDIHNGTPHSVELCSAFEAHNIDCPIVMANPCDGICNNPVPFTWTGSYQSGDLQTGAVCRETTQAATGGNCGNFAAGRTLSVNGTVMTCNYQNWASLPPARNGGYCISTTPGNYAWATFTLW